VTFYGSRNEHGLPIFGRKMAAGILFGFFTLPMRFVHRLSCRSFDLRRQPYHPVTVVAGTWTTVFTISRRPQEPRLGAFEQLDLCLLPGHPRPQWVPGGVALVRMRTVVWALLALDIQPLLVPALVSICNRGFSFRIACLCCQISVYRQLLD